MKFTFTDHPAFITIMRNRGGVVWSATFEVAVHLPDASWPDGSWSRHDRGFEPAQRWISAPTPELIEQRCLDFLRAHDDAVRSVKTAPQYARVKLCEICGGPAIRCSGLCAGMTAEVPKPSLGRYSYDGGYYDTLHEVREAANRSKRAASAALPIIKTAPTKGFFSDKPPGPVLRDLRVKALVCDACHGPLDVFDACSNGREEFFHRNCVRP